MVTTCDDIVQGLRKMNRDEVYSLIDSERSYQLNIWQQRAYDAGAIYRPDSEKTVAEWLIFIRGYLNDALREASHSVGHTPTLDVVRKLAGLCVACMENRGCVWRVEDRGQSCEITIPLCRGDVYLCINAERQYQDDLPPTRTDRRKHSGPQSVCHFLCMFERYLRKAIDDWTDCNNDLPALQGIRKLAAICVQCMEVHGAPARMNIQGAITGRMSGAKRNQSAMPK